MNTPVLPTPALQEGGNKQELCAAVPKCPVNAAWGAELCPGSAGGEEPGSGSRRETQK